MSNLEDKKFIIEDEPDYMHVVEAKKIVRALAYGETSCVYKCEQFMTYEQDASGNTIIPADAVCINMGAGKCRGDCIVKETYSRLCKNSYSLPKRIKIEKQR